MWRLPGILLACVLFVALRPFAQEIENANWRNNFAAVGIDFVPSDSAFDGTNFFVGGQSGFRRWDGAQWRNETIDGETPRITALASTPLGTFAAGSLPDSNSVHFLFRREGTNWIRFGPSFDDAIFAIATRDTNLFIGGNFRLSGTNELNFIAQWGGSTWIPLRVNGTNGVNSAVSSLFADENGDLFAGGYFTSAGGTPAKSIALWNGTAWSGLGSGLFYANAFGTSNVPANAIARWNGDLYVAGKFTQADSTAALRIARWDGAQWHSVGAGLGHAGDSSIEGLDLAATSSGLFVAGTFNDIDGRIIRGLARWDGTEWQPAMNREMIGHVFSLAAASTDLFLAGSFTIGNESFFNVARLEDGEAHALGGEVYGPINMLKEAGGAIYLGGDFLRAGSKNAQRIARLAGGEFFTLGSGMNGTVRAIAVAPDGTTYAGGDFTIADDQPIRSLARWNGTNWSSLGQGITGANPRVYALELHDGKLYVGGSFERAGTIAATNLAVWDGAGWSNIGNANGSINSLKWLHDRLYAGGTFTRIGNGTNLNNLASFDPLTGRWSDTGGGVQKVAATDSVRVTVLDTYGGDLLVGGHFVRAGTNRFNSIARWDGSRWHSFGSGPLNGVPGDVAAAYSRGKELYVAGSLLKRFDENDYINMFHWDGAQWSHLGSTLRGPVQALAALGNDLYVGGDFTPPSLNVWRMPAVQLSGSTNRLEVLGTLTAQVSVENFFAQPGVVALYQNSNFVADAPSNAAEFTLTNLAAGEYQLVAVATNANLDRIESAPFALTVAQPVGNQPPVVNLISPTNSAIFSADEAINFRATATDSDGTIVSTEFVRADGFILSASTFLPPGEYSVRARATDNRGGTTLTDAVSFRVIPANIPPVVFIEDPFRGELVTSANLQIRLEASDLDGVITNVLLRLDGAPVRLSSSNNLYSHIWADLPKGDHTISAIATDDKGAESEFNIQITAISQADVPSRQDILPDAQPFPGGWVTDGEVYTMLQTNGTLYLGGAFQHIAQQVPGSSVVELSAAAPDLSYPNVDGILNVIVPDGAGGYYIGGFFNSVGGHPVRNAAHILANKTVNTRWAPNPNSHVIAIAVDGEKVYLGGEFTEIAGEARRYLAAVRSSDGKLTDWNPTVNNWVSALAIRNRTLYVGGNFSVVSEVSRSHLAALDTRSAAVLPWKGTANDWITELLVSGDRLYVAGPFDKLNDVSRSSLGAFNAETGDLLAWDPWVQGQAYDIELSGSSLYISGAFSRVGGVDRANLAAVDATSGSLLPWRPDPDQQVESLTVLSNVVYVSGQFSKIGQPQAFRNRIAAVDAETGAVLPLDLNSTGVLWSMAVVNGKALGAGALGQLRVARNGLAAFDAISGYARAWDPKCSGPVYALAYLDDALYVGGEFHEIAGLQQPFAAALDPRTAAALPWRPNPGGGVHAIAAGVRNTNDPIYLGGTFQTIGNKQRRYLGSVDRSTGAVTDWNPLADDTVTSISADANHIYFGGSFKTVQGEPRNGFARVSSLNGVLESFNPDPKPGGVSQMIHSGDTLYVRGGFDFIGGKSRSFLAAIDKPTGKVTGWNVHIAPISMALVNNTLFVGGQFTTADNLPRTNIAAIDVRLREGAILPWAPAVGLQDYSGKWVSAIAASLDSVFVGGNFEDVAGEKRPFVAGFPFSTALQPLKFIPESLFQIRLIGPLGRTYIFEGSSDLINWTPMMTNRAPFLFEDLEMVNHPRRFYRARPQ